MNIDASCEFDRRGVTLNEDIDLPFQKISLNIIAQGPAINEELELVAQEVAKYCPLSKLFRQAGTEIVEHWYKA